MWKNLQAPFKAPFRKAQVDRDWAADQAQLPEVSVSGSIVSIKKMRDFRWGKVKAKSGYDDRQYDLEQLETAWFLVSPFGITGAMAHAWTSFGFADGSYVSISVEARRERREAYSPWRGLWRNYEVVYIIGDERDLIPLRTNFSGHDVYLFPIQTEIERMRRVFLELVLRAEKLRVEPEFYHTIWNTCTTNLVRHINTITPGRVPLDFRILLPGYSAKLAHRLGMIAGDGAFSVIKEQHRITDRVNAAPLDETFSTAIRKPE